RIVRTFVGANLVEDRMLARQVEMRRNPREVYRRADKCLAQALSVRPIIASAAIAIGITHGEIGFATVGKGRGKHIAVADFLAVQMKLFIDQVKLVAFPDVQGKVDVIAKNGREFRDHGLRESRLLSREEQ